MPPSCLPPRPDYLAPPLTLQASPHLTLGETAPASEFNAPNVRHEATEGMRAGGGPPADSCVVVRVQVVTHQSSEGALLAFDEEMHVVPIAPQRARVMLRCALLRPPMWKR